MRSQPILPIETYRMLNLFDSQLGYWVKKLLHLNSPHPDQLPTFRLPLLGLSVIVIALGLLNSVSVVWGIASLVFVSGLILPLSTVQIVLLVSIGLLVNRVFWFSSELLLLHSITFPSLILLGNLIRQFLRSIEWKLASRRILSAILESDSSATPSLLLRQALLLLKDIACADGAIALQQLDDVTAKVLVDLPANTFPTQINPSCFTKALDQNRPLYYSDYRSASDATSLLIALGVKSLIILPLQEGSNRYGAILLIWYHRTSLQPELRRFCESLVAGLRTLLRFEHTNVSLEKLQARYSAILETIPQGVIFVDESGEQGWVNQAAARELNLKPGAVAPEVLALAMAQLRASVNNPEQIAKQAAEFFSQPDAEIRDWLWTFNGSPPKVLNLSSTPTRMRDVPGRLWLLEDISERKLAELALQHSSAQLKQQTIKLEFALKELQQTQVQLIQTEKMSSLGQMVAGIAHEINNPVNFISANLQYANKSIQELLYLVQLYQQSYHHPNPSIKAWIEEIDLEFLAADLPHMICSMEMGTERIKQLVLSLRNFSRLDEAAVKQINLHEGIDNTLLLLNHRLIKGITVSKQYGDLPLLQCYPAQLNQVFMNILSNAIDALFEQTEQRDKRIVIQTERLTENQVSVRIQDNGSGIPAEIKDKIFDPFFTTKDVGKGTGLGLSICYKIIEKHGGKIVVNSVIGKGTEFVITLLVHLDGKG